MRLTRLPFVMNTILRLYLHKMSHIFDFNLILFFLQHYLLTRGVELLITEEGESYVDSNGKEKPGEPTQRRNTHTFN